MKRPRVEAGSQGAPCLELDHVSRVFGGLRAVDGVSLSIRPGERRAVIGPNGAGKTTLFNVISGEVPPTAGSIRFLGLEITSLAPYQRAASGIARTFQITRLFAALTVLENVLLACEALDAHKFALLRPLSSFRDLAARAAGLLDEPMAGLSSAERTLMLERLEHLDRGIAVMMIEHDMDAAFAFAESVIVLDQGRVLFEGHKDEVGANQRVQRIYLGSQDA